MSSLPPNTKVPKPQYVMYALASAGCLGLGFVTLKYYPGMVGYLMFVIALAQAVHAVKLYREHRDAMQLSRHGMDIECRFKQDPEYIYHIAVNEEWAADSISSPYMLRNIPEGARVSLAAQFKSRLFLVSEKTI